jgi:hypothetical protein
MGYRCTRLFLYENVGGGKKFHAKAQRRAATEGTDCTQKNLC